MSGAQAAVLARAWIGTPWCHGAACRGAGADCLGLVRGVWRDLYGAEPPDLPAYASDWAEAGPPGALLAGVSRHLVRVAAGAALRTGEVLVFRLSARGPAKHLGVLTVCEPQPRFVHACAGSGVVEVSLSAPWRRRLVARFTFPGT